MDPRTKADLCRNLAAGFALSARLAFEAGDREEQARCENTAALYERQADRLQQTEARG